MSTSGRIVKNTSFLYVKMIITTIISLYTARVFLNTLGASDYGLYTLVSGVIFMFGFLQDTLTRASLRYLCLYKAKEDIQNQKRVFSISVILHFAIALFILANLLFIEPFLFSGFLNIESDRVSAAKIVYNFMIVSFVFTVISIPYDSVLNANENMLYYSVVGIIESFLKLALAISLPYVCSDKLIFYSLILALITISSMIAKRIYCHMKYKECKFKLSLFDRTISKGMVSYAGWNFLTSISSLISFNAIPVVLNMFFGTILNAAQGIAAQVNGVLTQFSTNMVKALNPTITKSGGGDDVGRMMMFAVTGSKLSFLILTFIAVPIIFECPYILKVWLVNVPEWATVFCVMLIIRSLLGQLEAVYADCIYANADIKSYCIVKSILNLLPLPLIYFSFKMGGAPYMVYVNMLICWEILGGIVIIYYNRKMYNLDINNYLKELLFPCLSLLGIECATGTVICMMMESSFSRLVLTTIAVSVIFLLLSWFMILRKHERDLVKGMFIKWIPLRKHIAYGKNQ